MRLRKLPGPSKPRFPSTRQLKVSEEIRHHLAEVFTRGDLRDPVLRETGFTVSEVRASPDLRYAEVFISQFGQDGISDDLLKRLNKAGAYLGALVAKKINLKYAAQLRFVNDETLSSAGRIEELIRQEKKRSLKPQEKSS